MSSKTYTVVFPGAEAQEIERIAEDAHMAPEEVVSALAITTLKGHLHPVVVDFFARLKRPESSRRKLHLVSRKGDAQ